MIPSEQQAEQVGRVVTGGDRDRDFRVFSYVHKASRLTCFGVQIEATGRLVLADPMQAETCGTQEKRNGY